MSKQAKETFYVARYAFSDGVQEAVGRCASVENWVILDGYAISMKLGRDVFRNRAEAVRRAETMREKKIASLHKQVKKLTKLEFK